ncbi:MAG: DNA-directed RNA polymerase subunit omega [Victivallales bacterium]|jgi:hypothetical protein|nr:DNA-directed RNA polymerase subunit omega [Victivallales bacterium]
MNEEYLAKARQKMIEQNMTDVRMFIVGVSRRAAELAKGARSLVKLTIEEDAEKDYLNIALKEVAEGKVIIKPGK